MSCTWHCVTFYTCRLIDNHFYSEFFIIDCGFLITFDWSIHSQAAEDSVRFYQNLRGKEDETELLEIEMTKLRNSVANTRNDYENDGKTFKWSDFIENPARKAITIGIVLMFLNQFSGFFAMLTYTGFIFTEAGSSLSPNVSAIIVAVIQIIGTYMASLFVERAGRKVTEFILYYSRHNSSLWKFCRFCLLYHRLAWHLAWSH